MEPWLTTPRLEYRVDILGWIKYDVFVGRKSLSCEKYHAYLLSIMLNNFMSETPQTDSVLLNAEVKILKFSLTGFGLWSQARRPLVDKLCPRIRNFATVTP